MATVKVKCPVCKGEGVTPGMPPEVGIICRACDGSGGQIMESFEGREETQAYSLVSTSTQAHSYCPERSISYELFLKGGMPRPMGPV